MRVKLPLSALPIALSLFLAGCGDTNKGAPTSVAHRSGINPAALDPAIAPGDDFFEYVDGTWIKNHPIPPERSTYGCDEKLSDDAMIALRTILTNLAKDPHLEDPTSRKLRDFYATAMDESMLARQGFTPLNAELQRVAAVNSTDDVLAEAGHLYSLGADALCSFWIMQDEKQSDRYAAHIGQGGTGLPERDYYLATDADSVKIREAYRAHVGAIFTLAGETPAQAAVDADTVLRIETRLAQASRTPTQLRDDEANYNKKTLAEFAALTPNAHWDAYFHALPGDNQPAPDFSYLIVGQPEFFTTINELLVSVPVAEWRTYLRWQLLHEAAPYLSSGFEMEHFHFYGQILNGAKQMEPRWKRAIHAFNHPMGEALGRLYVAEYFPPASKERVNILVHHILDAYRERLASREWMSPETRKLAVAKLAAINLKLGYPDKWRDCSGLDIRTDSFVQNRFRANNFEARFWLGKLNQPIDRSLWDMTPQTVNAYYDPNLNEIVFPAAILQLPYFNPTTDDAVNYGAIGAVIGHEITHGFDDQGSKYDPAGNLKDWWTPEDRARFTAKTDKLVQEFDACVATDDIHINGKLTLGENIADLGGLTIAYDAYLKSLNGKEAPVIDNLTGAQRFFIGFAASWCETTRDALQRVRLRTDPHSPPKFRVLVPLSNFGPFYDAFHVTPANKMYRAPADRAEIW